MTSLLSTQGMLRRASVYRRKNRYIIRSSINFLLFPRGGMLNLSKSRHTLRVGIENMLKDFFRFNKEIYSGNGIIWKWFKCNASDYLY